MSRRARSALTGYTDVVSADIRRPTADYPVFNGAVHQTIHPSNRLIAMRAKFRPPLAQLSSIRLYVDKRELRLPQRLSEAAFDIVPRLRNHSRAHIAQVVSTRVAIELEQIVRSGCGRSQRGWEWATEQRKRLGSEILLAARSDDEFPFYIQIGCTGLLLESVSLLSGHCEDLLHGLISIPCSTAFDGFSAYLTPLYRCLEDREFSRLFKDVMTCIYVCEAVLGVDPHR